MKAMWIGIAGLIGLSPAAAGAAELYAMGYAGATNYVEEQRSATGSVHVAADRFVDYFANNRTYRDISTFSAYTAYGVNKAFGGSNSQAYSTTGSALSQWSDTFVVNAGASSGFIRAIFDISYDLYVTPYGNVTASFNFTAGQRRLTDRATLNEAGYDLFISGAESVTHITQGQTSRRQLTFLIPFTSGQQVTVMAALGCNAVTGRATPPNIASCDAGHSAYWGGVTDVVDASGNAIGNWSLTAASGTDYRQSFAPAAAGVPEPATWTMLILGFGAVGGAMRRRVARQFAIA